MNPLIQLKKATPIFLGVFVLVCLTLSPRVQAVVPPPNGGYPGGNTAEGTGSLQNLTTGIWNTANGYQALFHTTTGGFNTATGFNALYSNTTGTENVANGVNALHSNTIGNGNTATGVGTLYNNTIGHHNTANGSKALYSNINGFSNTATGDNALFSNLYGYENVANGNFALYRSTTGYYNTAIGDRALTNNRGNGNTALGAGAGYNLTTGDNNIDIDNDGVAGESNTIRIGEVGVQNATFVAGIHGATTSGGVAVYVNSSGRLGTLTSSARFKQDVHSMDKASETILALKPVTFRYRREIDTDGIPQFGLIAEEVAKVNPDLVVRDRNGEIYSVRYEAVNAMLLNEFLKARRQIDAQQKQIQALTAGLQRVSAQLAAASPSDGGLERSKFATGRIRRGGPAPQTAQNTE